MNETTTPRAMLSHSDSCKKFPMRESESTRQWLPSQVLDLAGHRDFLVCPETGLQPSIFFLIETLLMYLLIQVSSSHFSDLSIACRDYKRLLLPLSFFPSSSSLTNMIRVNLKCSLPKMSAKKKKASPSRFLKWRLWRHEGISSIQSSCSEIQESPAEEMILMHLHVWRIIHYRSFKNC